MTKKYLVIQPFNEKEQRLINSTIERMKKSRRYGTRATFYHDALLLGCQALRQQQGTQEA